MSLLVPSRRDEAEWMDRDDNPPAELERALRNIAWVNRRLGGARALLRGIDPYLREAPAGSTVEILDVGSGGGDLAEAMVAWGGARGRRVRVTALDRDPVAAAFAARQAKGDVRIVRADASSLPFPEKSFDLVTASLFLHHFRHPEAVALIAGFRRLARRAVIINELRRHRLPWAFITLAALVTRRGVLFTHDAPLSVLRGFTETELRGIAWEARDARDPGAPEATIVRSWPFRLLLALPGDGPGL
jgi:SAM-dependent methyltransferase